MYARKRLTILAAVAVIAVTAASTAWWLADRGKAVDRICSLVAFSSSAWVIPSAPIQRAWPTASTYEACLNGECNKPMGKKNFPRIVAVSTDSDDASMPVSIRVLDANGRALWTRELTVEAKDFEPNGKGCGTYYEAGVALDVTARELRPRPVPPEFSMASYEAD
jgi:hypothetical protein